MLCSDPLGMESGAIPDENLKSSSSLKKEEDETHSRLNTGGVWVAKTDKVGGDEWLGITFGDVPAIITAVATQGRPGHPASWVTKYKLQYLDESEKLVYYREKEADTDKVLNNTQIITCRCWSWLFDYINSCMSQCKLFKAPLSQL